MWSEIGFWIFAFFVLSVVALIVYQSLTGQDDEEVIVIEIENEQLPTPEVAKDTCNVHAEHHSNALPLYIQNFLISMTEPLPTPNKF